MTRLAVIGGLLVALGAALLWWRSEAVENALKDAALRQIEASADDAAKKEDRKNDVADDSIPELLLRFAPWVRDADDTGNEAGP